MVSLADVAAGKTKVIAPTGFMEAINGEAVVAGNVTARCMQYPFGFPLPLGERGNVDYGEGKARHSLEPPFARFQDFISISVPTVASLNNRTRGFELQTRIDAT